MAKTNKDGQATMQSKNDKMFYFVKDKEGKIHICVGGYAVTEKTFDKFEQAEQYVGTKPWDIIVNVCYLILNKKAENHETKNEDPQNK